MSVPLSARQLWLLIANSDLTGSNPASALSIAWPASKLRCCEERLRPDLLSLVQSGHVEICLVGPGVARGPWPRSAPIPPSVLQGAVLGEGFTRLPQTSPAPTIACTGLGIEAVDFLQAGEDGESVEPLWEDETRAHITALHADLDILASHAGGVDPPAEAMTEIERRLDLAKQWLPFQPQHLLKPWLSPLILYASAALVPEEHPVERASAWVSVHKLVRRLASATGTDYEGQPDHLPRSYADALSYWLVGQEPMSTGSRRARRRARATKKAEAPGADD